MHKPRINSFDLFDTLVFRISGSPESVFYQLGDKQFVYNRKQAEQRSKLKTLEDIYNIMQTMYNWSNDKKTKMMMKELRVEFNGLYPIISNVKKVKKDDIIVSDMYLPYDFVKSIIVNICGLNNELYLSYDGKGSGEIWQEIFRDYTVDTHTGDDIEKDVNIPTKYGIKTIFSKIAHILTVKCSGQNMDIKI